MLGQLYGGYLLKQNYKEGTTLKKGDLLFEIDPRPFKAAFDILRFLVRYWIFASMFGFSVREPCGSPGQCLLC